MLIVALDPKSDLAEGDIQLFEEVLGPVVVPKLVSARRKTTLAACRFDIARNAHASKCMADLGKGAIPGETGAPIPHC
jgi:hypothetical protein